MSEADEIAASLLKQWFKTSGCSLSEYINAMLPESSEQMRDDVKEAMEVELRKYRHDGKLSHVWKLGVQVGMRPTSILADIDVCANCGVLRGNSKYPETACKGKTTVKPRS